MPDGPFDVINACRAIKAMPDGSPIKSGLAHTLLLLATYQPNIWPAQELLAEQLHVSRRQVNNRLRELEDSGLIYRTKRSGGFRSTLYGIRLSVVRKCEVGFPVAVKSASQEHQRGERQSGNETAVDYMEGF